MGSNSRAYLVLFILTGLNLFNYMDRFLLNGVLAPIQREFQLSDGELGRLNTAFMLTYFLTSPFFGWLGDRLSRKKILAVGVVLGGIGTMATSFAGSLRSLIGCRALVGFAEAGYSAVSPSLLADFFQGAKRNWAFSIYYAALPLGAAAGFLVGGQVHEIWGWRAAFFWVGVVSIGLALSLQFFSEPERGVNEGQLFSPPTSQDLKALFKNVAFMKLVLGFICYTFSLGALSIWAPMFLQRYHGESNSQATLFFGATAVITGLFGTLLGGYVTTRWGDKKPALYPALLTFSIVMPVPLLAWAFQSSSGFVCRLGCFLAMFCLFLSTGPINTLIYRAVPLNLRSSSMALTIFAIHAFGDLWSPELVGHLSDSWGELRWAMYPLIAVFFLGGIFWSWPLFLVLEKKKPHYA